MTKFQGLGLWGLMQITKFRASGAEMYGTMLHWILVFWDHVWYKFHENWTIGSSMGQLIVSDAGTRCRRHLQWCTPSENQHKGEIAKLRDMVAVEVHWERLWNTFVFSHRDLGMHWILSWKPHKAVIFELWIHKTKFMKPKWYNNQDTTPQHVYTRHLQNFH